MSKLPKTKRIEAKAGKTYEAVDIELPNIGELKAVGLTPTSKRVLVGKVTRVVVNYDEDRVEVSWKLANALERAYFRAFKSGEYRALFRRHVSWRFSFARESAWGIEAKYDHEQRRANLHFVCFRFSLDFRRL